MSQPDPQPVEFWFDFSSPYAYLASTRIEAVAAANGRTVAWKPFLLGAAFKVTGMQPGPVAPLRGAYVLHDAPRFGRLIGVPLTIPEGFPIAGVTPSRVALWVERTRPDLMGAACKALMAAYFADGRDISDARVAGGVVGALGLDAAAAAAATQDQAIKDALKAQVDEGLSRGVFGSPYVFADGEPFWGADRLDHVDLWLKGKGRA